MATPSEPVSPQERERRVQHPVARRMVQTARRLLAERGAAGTTARAIQQGTPGSRGPSLAPGSLFYYFGSKERVLIEVLRAEVAQRLELLAAELAKAISFDDFLDALAHALGGLLDAERGSAIVMIELVGEARRQPELATAQAQLYQHWRAELTAMLEDLKRRHIIALRGPARPLAELIIAAEQGLAIEQSATPGWDRRPPLAMLRELLRATIAPPQNS